MTNPGKEAGPIAVLHLTWAVNQLADLKTSREAVAKEKQRLTDWTNQFGPAVVLALRTHGSPTTNPIDGRQQWKTPAIPTEVGSEQIVPSWLEGTEDRTGDLTDVSIRIGGGDILFQYVRGEVLTWKDNPPDNFEQRLGTNLLESMEYVLAERQSSPPSTS